jgi:eukaryotic-like serine/threonine-protein kinase
MSPTADRNLLLGILALQLEFITRDALIAAMLAWSVAKHRPLEDILVDQGTLDPADRDLLRPMVGRHVAKHGGTESNLAALERGRHRLRPRPPDRYPRDPRRSPRRRAGLGG